FVSETLVFSADIKTYTDYYAFGMEMVGRNWSEGEAYRFGHNGQEKSKEVGEDNYTAEFWEYDSHVARRWNIDPVVKEYESPYLAFGGNPILFADPKGDDIINLDEIYRQITEAKLKLAKLSHQNRFSGKILSNMSEKETKNYENSLKNVLNLENDLAKYTDASKNTQELINYYNSIDPETFQRANNGRVLLKNTYSKGYSGHVLDIYLTTSEEIEGNNHDGQTISSPKLNEEGDVLSIKINFSVANLKDEKEIKMGVKIRVKTDKLKEGKVTAHEFGHYFDIINKTKKYFDKSNHPKKGGCQTYENSTNEFVKDVLKIESSFTDKENNNPNKRKNNNPNKRK
ncbi:MAG: hypothetical protein EAZ06_10190, partial [Cytophagales bacterium]